MTARRSKWILIPLLFLAGCGLPSVGFNWTAYHSKEFGITLDLPYPPKEEITESTGEDEVPSRMLEVDSDSSASATIFEAAKSVLKNKEMHWFTVYLLSGIREKREEEYDPGIIIQGYKEHQKKSLTESKAKNIRFRDVPTTISGMPATLLVIDYEDYSASGEGEPPLSVQLNSVYVFKPRQFWNINVLHTNPQKYAKEQKRVFDSVKIAPKPR